jgi:hypothetical protein
MLDVEMSVAAEDRTPSTVNSCRERDERTRAQGLVCGDRGDQRCGSHGNDAESAGGTRASCAVMVDAGKRRSR